MTKLNWNRPPQREPGWSITDRSKRKRPTHKHQWTRWQRIAIFDPTEISKCTTCGHKRRRKPK